MNMDISIGGHPITVADRGIFVKKRNRAQTEVLLYYSLPVTQQQAGNTPCCGTNTMKRVDHDS